MTKYSYSEEMSKTWLKQKANWWKSRTRGLLSLQSTWEALSNIKPPGKSLGDTVVDLITEHQKRMLERDLDEIDANGRFIPWEKAKKELGL